MEEEVNKQSKTAEGKRTKRIEAARTLKIFENDLTKAREELKNATRDRDSAQAGLKGA